MDESDDAICEMTWTMIEKPVKWNKVSEYKIDNQSLWHFKLICSTISIGFYFYLHDGFRSALD